MSAGYNGGHKRQKEVILMAGFHDIIGHDDIIRHLKNAIETGKVSHSYIFTGEPGSGKKLLAGTFAAALQCESGESEPCMTCDSCKKVIGKNHPDIITVTHEKPGSISIDEVRDQVVRDVDIKPYCSPYKIYIIPDAEMMTVQAQNAILKTIEEPPEYAVIMLLTSNIDSLLPTIRSRCVRLDLKVVDDSLVKEYLMEHLQVPDYQAEIDASLQILFLDRSHILCYMAMEAVAHIRSVRNALNDSIHLTELLYLKAAETLCRCSVDRIKITIFLLVLIYLVIDIFQDLQSKRPILGNGFAIVKFLEFI